MAFHYSSWLDTSLPNRIKLATRYGVVKKGSTHVVGNRVVSDGYDLKEVELMLEKMFVEFPGDDMKEVIQMALNTIEGRTIPIIELPKKRRGRPKTK